MKIRKKKFYYICSIVMISLICSLGPFINVNSKEVSVLQAIFTLSAERLREHSMFSAFSSTGMIELMLPVVCSLPSASFIYDEIKNGVSPYLQMRRGRYGYVYSGYLYSVVSSAMVSFAGLMLYMGFCAVFFPVKGTIVIEGFGLLGEMKEAAKMVIYLMVYGASMSVFASFMIYIYPNLYFVMSLLFIISYVLRDIVYLNVIWYPLIFMVIMAVAYRIMWRYRSERV